MTSGQIHSGPALEPMAMLDGIRRRIAALQLDLTGLNVVTEAATGAYVCTALIAAMAGAASVRAVGRDTRRYGSYEDAVAATTLLARTAGVVDRISFSRSVDPDMLATCDILTNSGHLRPISRDMIARLPPTAVIGLMFEAWEFRETDLDLKACRERGIRVAAVNERHPDVGVFPFLGPLCVRLLEDAGVPLPASKVALLCDNAFASFILQGLTCSKCDARLFDSAAAVPAARWDVVVVALDPARNAPLGDPEFAHLAEVAGGARVAQFWGDVDRAVAARHGFAAIAPAIEPEKGHMGVLLSALGPEPILRLQAGGLKAAEFVRRGGYPAAGAVAELL
jgi:hypothetical protein